MANPWNDLTWRTLKLSDHALFNKTGGSQIVLNSPIVFAGSCDINGIRHGEYWHEIYCESLGLRHEEYTLLGDAVNMLPSLVRKLYVYLKMCDTKPAQILLVAPVSVPEHIIEGKCYSITHRVRPLDFLYRLGAVPARLIPKVSSLQQAYNVSFSRDQEIYNFCRDFSFLEMMCAFYDIDLKWTPNRTGNASLFYKSIDDLLDAHPFAKSTFIGYEPTYDIDEKFDAPTASSHKSLAAFFLSTVN
jgi:hypothetical protein